MNEAMWNVYSGFLHWEASYKFGELKHYLVYKQKTFKLANMITILQNDLLKREKSQFILTILMPQSTRILEGNARF